MPIGPYKDFAACVVAQQNKGKSKESAQKICGTIEKRSKGELSEASFKESLGDDYSYIKTLEWLNN